MKKENTTKDSVHKGHRQRLTQRFAATGGKDFNDHELLELLLCYPLPRVNTNGIAHDLIDEFGSLGGAIKAEPDMIECIHGAGPSVSTFLSLIYVIVKRMDLEKYNIKRFSANKLANVGNFLVDYYKDNRLEAANAMLLDSSLKLIEFMPLSAGTANSSNIDIGDLVRHAVLRRATHVILSHNHPSGNTTPSPYDTETSMRHEAALQIFNIELLEHIIVNEISYTPTLHMRTSLKSGHLRSKTYQNFYND